MLSQDLDALRAKTVDLRGVADLRLVALENGPGRGQRLLLMRNAAAVELEIAVDRGFDIAALRWRGLNIGWNSPAGGPAPVHDLDADQGLGLLRRFDGFLVTCGLDHFGLPQEGPADHFLYPNRSRVRYPLHGRVSTLPATLITSGLNLGGDPPALMATAEVRQQMLGGEMLILRRTVTLEISTPRFSVEDKVTNLGSRPSRHGMLYHVNFGYPFLDEALRLGGAFGDQFIEAFAKSPPQVGPDACQTVDPIQVTSSSNGLTRLGLYNSEIAGGMSVELTYSSATLPGLSVWRSYQSGLFVLGIEPNSGLSDAALEYLPGSPHFLSAGASRSYSLAVRLS